MKTAALLLILLSVLLVFGFGFFYLLGFAMSFDAPGSDKSPAAWGMRILMLTPILIFIVFILLAWIAFQAGNYRRSVILGLIPPAIGIALLGIMAVTSFASLSAFRRQRAQEEADARRYPVQKFMRPVEGGTDTIIVFPSRIVAYRKYMGTEHHWGGPLGDLNESRDVILYYHHPDNRIPKEELNQFIDETGRKLTDVYQVR